MAHAHLRSGELHMLIDHMVRHMEKDQAVPALVDCLPSPHARTRRVAAYFLGYFDAPEHAALVMPLLEDDDVRRVALRTLGKWGVRDAVPDVILCLGNEEERSRVAAANALRDIGDRRAVPHLIRALDDPFFTVRYCAERALRVLGDVEAEVLEALGDASPRARAHLLHLVENP
jgi:HEAT repeat protein